VNGLGDFVSRLAKVGDGILSKFPGHSITSVAAREFLDADVIFTCAVCGERVGRYRKAHKPMRWQVPNDFTCSRHGRLRDDTLDDIDEKWIARGKPERMTVKLRPERRGGSR